MNSWAQSEGFGGLGWATCVARDSQISLIDRINAADRMELDPERNVVEQELVSSYIRAESPADFEGLSGPIAKWLTPGRKVQLILDLELQDGDGVFFAAGKEAQAAKLAGLARTRVAEQLGLIDDKRFEFCWIVDFPMFEYDEDAKKVDFSHNPFSMPQGEMEALETKDPLDILAYQYDIVCNGIELSSGAIRNHRPEIMYKAFEIAGYTQADVDTNFAGMINAFKFGAPPHGGSAPGVDRIVMLLADEPNIREVITFPMTQKAEDLMMGAPNYATPKQLKELHIKLVDQPGGKG